MKLENTTIFSAIVWIAGVLAEVIFHDELSASMLGIILSVVLAFIVIMTTYFVIDGVNSVLLRERAEADERQREYQDKMFKLLEEKLNEQLKFEKAIYACVKSVKDNGEEDASLQDIIQAVNDNTIQAAKIIAKYQTKTSGDIESVLKEIKEEFPKLYSEIREKKFTIPEGMISSVSNVSSMAGSSVADELNSAQTGYATAIDMLKETNEAEDFAEQVLSEESAIAEEMMFEDASGDSEETDVLEEPEDDIEQTVIEESETLEESDNLDELAISEETEISDQMESEDIFEEETEENPEVNETPEVPIEESEDKEDEVISDPNAIMTPEEIEKLLAAQSEQEEEPMAIEESEEDDEEPVSDPNASMSQDDIAALLASMNN